MKIELHFYVFIAWIVVTTALGIYGLLATFEIGRRMEDNEND